ncbi:hypothetical protein [Thalassovita sp.]|uniref:hypothetical protein n=1 Tax=Thalassovita sp. TaxID=1979401 RepID=UPI002B275C93|nr:hypothetical protein [Thalassovita sp.]
MKTFFCVLMLSPVPVIAAAPTFAAPRLDPLRVVATCAGRLSAQMEFQWMFDGSKADATKAVRASLIDILAAMTPPGQAREVLNWRVEAKIAQAALLRRSMFNPDKRDARWAQRAAQHKIGACRSLLLT